MSIRESRFGRLTEHFFAGFLDNDLLLSPGAGMENALSQAIGLIVAPGLFYCVLAYFKYSPGLPNRDLMAFEDQLLLIGFTMALTGLLSTMEWDALFPDRRDYQILTPLPVTMRLLFLAKLSAVLLLLVVLWAAANLGPAILFPTVVLTEADPWFALPRYFAAHLLATFAASAFVFLFFIGLEGILLNILSAKWYRRVSVYAQLAAMVAVVLSFFLLPLLLARAVGWIRGNSPWMNVLPPFWFGGLYQVLIGHGGAVFSRLGAMALEALGATGAVAALAYAVSYRRHVKRSLESLEPVCSGPGAAARAFEAVLHRFALRHPLERGCFHFIKATLLRSRIHRLLLAAYLGLGFALVLGTVTVMVLNAMNAAPRPGLLSVQLVLLFVALCGMRFVFTVPAELRANWAFQATEPPDKRRCGAGTRKAMLAFGVCPVLLGLLPLHYVLWGGRTAALHLLYGGAVSMLLIEALLVRFDKIPFTCTYLPGRANVKSLWPAYLALFWVYAYALAKLEYGLLAGPTRFVVFMAAVLAGAAALRWYDTRHLRPGFQFLFEDLPEPAVQTLDIGH